MFETTLEAQALHAGERRLGTLSAAALAHLGIGLAVVAISAVIVPTVQVPEPQTRLIMVPLADPLLGEVAPPRRPPAKKGSGPEDATKAVVLPPADPVTQPTETPDETPEASPAPGEGDDRAGDAGVPDGASRGIPGGIAGESGGGGGGGPVADVPVPLTGGIERPVLLSKTEPVYPNAARIARLPGKVLVEAVIGLDGRVESVEVISSTSALFDGAAVDAVRRWRYTPALMNGRPVRVYFKVAVSFVIR